MIEKLELKDLDRIMSIWLNTNVSAHPFIPKTYWENAFQQVKEAMLTAEVYIYQEDSVVKGFVGIMDHGYIAGLFIAKRFQAQGIGHKLMNYCKQKYQRLELDVFTENVDAVRFYQNNKFEISETKISVMFNHEEHHMVWKLE